MKEQKAPEQGDAEERIKYLLSHRAEGLKYCRVEMTEEEKNVRRECIRQILKATRFNNLSNETIDKIRIIPLSSGGYIYEDDDGREYYLKSAKELMTEGVFRQKRSEMPPEFVGMGGSAFDWDVYGVDITATRKLINSFILKFRQFQDKGMGLYIYSGTKGSGKTMLSCCILNEIAKRYAVVVKFINALDLLEFTKKSYREKDTEPLDWIYTAAVLVIDDLGVQAIKEWIDTVFYRIVNTRYNSRLVTLYTSNIAPDKLKMDDRIVDRIEATTYTVKLPEKAVRSEKRTEEKEKVLHGIYNATPQGAEGRSM